MKREVLQFEVARPKTRAHRVLFVQHTPFKPKQVTSKVLYKRKSKHSKKWADAQ